MSKIRVYELARDLKVNSKDILDIAQKMGLELKNHMSTLDSGEVSALKNRLTPGAEKKTSARQDVSPPATPSSAQKEARPQSRPAGINRSQAGPAGSNRPQPRPAGTNPPHAGPAGGSNRPQSRPAGSNRPQTGPAGSNRPQTGSAGSNRPQAGPAGSNRPQAGPAGGNRPQAGPAGSNRPQQRPGFGGNNPRQNRPQGGGPGRKNRNQPGTKPPEKPAKPAVPVGPVKLEPRYYTVAELEKSFSLPVTKIIKGLMGLGVMATINQTLDFETVEILGAQLGIEIEIVMPEVEEVQEDPGNVTITEENSVDRAPVVTVMGHVDHGKTSLLDAIRNANVTAGEAGGITQHIGAYQVEHQGKKIVFLDTPGHEAFTSMRARGAKITDMAILVVAADEGVMPQTIEALNHAKAAQVPIIVALNKMDKAGANPDRVKQQLAQLELVPEDWGGNTIYVEVSAISGTGIESLLGMILLVAEMAELKAASNRPALGTVIEAKLDKGRGPVVTVLIQHGEVKVGDSVVCGSTHGRVRAMFSHVGQRINNAQATVPVEILGLTDVPPAGEIFRVVSDEKMARQMADKASIAERALANSPKARVSLDEVFLQMEQSLAKELNLVLKSDVQGTTEALKQSLSKINVKEIRVKIVHDGVGAITSSDVMLASASGAIIIGFNVRPDTQAQKLAEEENVEIRLYRVIYNVIDDVKAALAGLLDPEFVELVLGRAEVRHLFKYSKLGTIAGCHVIDGKITSNASCRLLREGKIVYEGKLSSLKRFKEDVKEVSSGYECGIMLENYHDLKEGDQIEAFMMKQK